MNNLVCFSKLKLLIPRSLLAVMLVVAPLNLLAAPAALTYQGRIVKSDGNPLEYSAVGFIFQVTDPTGSCVIYQEQVSGYNMVNSNGIFDVPIGKGTISFPLSGSYTILDAFNNSVVQSCGNCSGYTCSVSSSTYTPVMSDGRLLRVQFYDGVGWKTISPDTAIRSVPFAAYAHAADKLGTNTASDFLLKAGLPTCAAGTFLTWNGTALTCSPAGAGSVTSLTGSAPLSVINGTTTPTISIAKATSTTDGYLSAADWNAFNNKQATGNYITTLTGDVTATGPGSAAASIAKIQGSTVTLTSPQTADYFRYNGTAFVNSPLQASDLTGTISATNLPAFSGDVNSAAGSSILTLSATGTAGTYYKVTTDSKGRVTSGATSLLAADIPNLDWNKITTGKPTTLSGYGITDSLVSNLGGTPGIQTGLDASKPASPSTGTIYFATDSKTIYQYNSSAWVNIASSTGSGGTVSSVGLSLPSIFSVTNSPVTNTGTLTATLATQSASTVLAAPAAGGTPIFRTLNISDIKSKVSGDFFTASGGCPSGQTLTYTSANDTLSCQAYSLTNSQVTAALGYSPATSALNSGQIFVGDATNTAAPVTMNGDAILSNAGALTLASSGVTAGTYKSVTVDAKGRVTSGANPTTLAGYGITDAVKNAGGVGNISAGLDAVKPGTPASGDLFVATDSQKIYRYNGASWDLISSAGGSGGTVTSVATGTGLSGGTITGTGTIAVADTAVAAGSYGSATQVPTFTVNAQGQLTAAGNTAIALPWSAITSGTPTTLAGYGITDSLVSNLGGTPGIKTGTDATKPASPVAGTIYFATDTKTIYQYNAGSWVNIASSTGSGGTVSSVGLSLPSIFSVTNSPVTNTGTLTATLATQSASTVLAAPAAGGTPTFRTLNISDIQSTVAGSFFTASGGCPSGQTLTYTSATDTLSCQAYSLTSSQVTTALGYNPATSALNSGQFFVGDATNTAAPVTMSGDAILSNAGALTLAFSGVTAGTYKSVTVDAKGRVTSGANPTTLTGYGITDSLVSNLGGTPGIQTGLDASKPASPSAGTIYFATDSKTIYQYNSSAWVNIASSTGSGGTVTNVSSANSDIGVASGTSTPVLTLNSASANTASTIVKRDGSGNFAAGAVTLSTSAIFKDTGANTVTIQAPTSIGTSYVLKLPANVASVAGQVLTASDTSGTLAWSTPSTPSLADGKIWVGQTGTATAVTPSGDLSTTNAGVFTVGGIKGKTVSAAPTIAGQVLRYDGTNWTPNFISMLDLRSTITGTTALASACTASQTLTYNSVGDNLTCSNIAIADSQITYGSQAAKTFLAAPTGAAGAPTYRTIASTDLPTTGATGLYMNGGNSFGAAATLGTNDSNTLGFKTNNSTRMTIDTSGNVGVGTASPQKFFDVRGDSIFYSSNTPYSEGTNLFYTSNAANGGGYNLHLGAVGAAPAAGTLKAAMRVRGTNGNFWIDNYYGSTDHTLLEGDNTNNNLWLVPSTGKVGIGTTSPGAALDVKGAIRMSGATSGYTGFQPAAAAGSTVWTLPATDGGNGQFLMTDGAGTLSWANSGSGSAVTLPVGSAAAPSLNFTGDTTTGLYQGGAGVVGISSAGSPAATFSSSGLTLAANKGLTLSSGTGTISQTYTGNGTAQSITANSLTNGSALAISSSSMTNGNLQSLTANALQSGNILSLSAVNGSQAGLSNAVGLNLNMNITSGSSSTAVGVKSVVALTGGSSTAWGGYFSASGASTNYGLIVAAGSTGISNTAPATPLEVATANIAARPASATATINSNVGGANGAGSYDTLVLSNGGTNPSTSIYGSALSFKAATYGGTSSLSTGRILSYFDTSGGSNPGYPGAILALQYPTADNTYGTGMVLRNGNVGIGTTSPGSTLDVSGTIRTDTICDRTGANCKTISGGWGAGAFPLSGTDGTVSAPTYSFANNTNTGMYNSAGVLSFTSKGTARLTLDSASNSIASGNWQFNGTPLSSSWTVISSGSAASPNIKFNGLGSGMFFTSGTEMLGFSTSATERMRIDASGNVGMGTTSPQGPLDVQGGTSSGAAAPITLVGQNANSGTSNSGGNIVLTAGNAAAAASNRAGGNVLITGGVGAYISGSPILSRGGGVTITGGTGASSGQGGAVSMLGGNGGATLGAGGSASVSGGTGSGTYQGGAVSITGGTGGATDANGGNATVNGGAPGGAGSYGNVLLANSGGNVGIGTSTPSYSLHVVGTAGLSSGTAWTNASDIRLKDIQGDYEYGLNEVLQLHTVRYNYKKDNPLGLPSDFSKTGFIAQEVQKVIPDAVSTRKDGYLELNVDPIHWAVVNAIKDLYKKWFDDSVAQNREIASLKAQKADKVELEALKQENAAKDKEINELKNRLERIEKALTQHSGQ
ncbi:tail fiber domain-containing protein [Bdellovibrio svalbardensis]|uniref:Tail fiber domain-containing protein n=1 Tax=Bdellovibrio svalbardensis TaxID=2972972 RepID=A0ABT6DG39_9BACT|nr:tail fiber domain-containing protein [Bdellovibrio svalbardensis]MDG0815816.1 tail fiber domain-containing protein [Bdellovibrio svalbardensis]